MTSKIAPNKPKSSSMEDLLALHHLLPCGKDERPIAWISRAKRDGLINETDWENLARAIKDNA